MGIGDGAMFKLWLLLVRIVAPLVVAAIFVSNLA
jgi:SNF family Na+-dependent transporter